MTRKLAAAFAPLLIALSLIAHTAEPAEGAERGGEACATAHEWASISTHMPQAEVEVILDGPGYVNSQGVHVYRLCGRSWRHGQLWLGYSKARRAATVWWIVATAGQLALPEGLFLHQPAK